MHKNLARATHGRWNHQSSIPIEAGQHHRLTCLFGKLFARRRRSLVTGRSHRTRLGRRRQRRSNQVRRCAPLYGRRPTLRSGYLGAGRRHAHIFAWMGHAAGISSAGRRVCTGCANKVIGRQGRLGRRIGSVRVRPCDNVHTVAPTTAAHPMHRARSRLSVPSGMPLPAARPARGSSLSHGLKFRGTAALAWNNVRRRTSTTNTSRTCASAMRYKVRGSVAGRDPSSVRRIRLRQHLTHQAEHRESHHYAPHGNPHRCARSLVRACALFRLSVAPLRHHHHKFLGGREAAELLQPIPKHPAAIVPMRMHAA